MNEVKYEQDFYAWTQEQARLLREGRFAELDVVNVAEEIESLGRSEKRELESRLCILLLHLLKWQLQPVFRSRSWQLSVAEQRYRVVRHLKENPGLKAQLDAVMADAFHLALIEAEKETGLPGRSFPATCPWSYDQVVSDDFWPE